LADLLTTHEAEIDNSTAEFRFNIELLAERVVLATDHCRTIESVKHLPFGYFGASTGAAAALIAAAYSPTPGAAIVSRGRRPLSALKRRRAGIAGESIESGGGHGSENTDAGHNPLAGDSTDGLCR